MSATGSAASRATDAIESAAAEWLVRRQGGFAPEEARRFEAWLAADARHGAALAELEAAWATLNFPGQVGRAEEAKRQLAARAVRRGRRRFAAAAAAVALAAVVFVGVQADRWAARESAVVSAVTPRPDTQTLPDGSTVELNAGAEIAVEFTPAVRAVRLVKGEALFSVQKNPARPFVVSAGDVAVRAVGTAFAVRHGGEAVGVLVTEGRVAVERASPAPETAARATPLLVAAGGRVEVPVAGPPDPALRVSPVSAAEMATALAWRGHRVEFTRTTLAEAVAVFNRQNRVQIAVADPAVGRIAISGIFWADDPESFVRLLESGFAVRAVRTGDTLVLRGR